jgi:microsomal epoxide hydrolase
LFNRLMTEVLGYDTYLAQGGDWGAVVTSWLGFDHGRHAKAIHLNMLAFRPADGPTTEEERTWAARAGASAKMKTAYQQLQITRPQSIAWMAAGNPVGQAAWIIERFHDWADLRQKAFAEVFSRDRLLTNVMIYVMTGSFTTGAWYYRGLVEEDGFSQIKGRRCETPTAFAAFPGEPLSPPPPRSYAARAYNITRWSDLPRGGHFAAMEEPDLFAEDIKAWGREADGREHA